MGAPEFWAELEDWLRWYFLKGRLVAWSSLPFQDRRGLLVASELLVLMALNAGIAWSSSFAWVAVPIALYVAFEVLVANTVIVFLTGGPISPLRSAVLTLVGYFNLAQSFATLWVLLSNNGTDSVLSQVVTAIYQSVRVLATAGPSVEMPTLGQKVLSIVEMLVGIYFLVIVFAIYSSWAKTNPRGKA